MGSPQSLLGGSGGGGVEMGKNGKKNTENSNVRCPIEGITEEIFIYVVGPSIFFPFFSSEKPGKCLEKRNLAEKL